MVRRCRECPMRIPGSGIRFFSAITLQVSDSLHWEFVQFRVNRPLGPKITPEENHFIDEKGTEFDAGSLLDHLSQGRFPSWGSHPAQSQVGPKGAFFGGKSEFSGS